MNKAEALSEPVTVKLYGRKKGDIYSNKVLLAFQSESKKIEAFGTDAERYIHHPEPSIVVCSPTTQGVIWDYTVFQKCLAMMIQYYNKTKSSLLKPKIMLCIPGDLPMSEVSLKAYMDAVYQTGAKKVDITKASFEDTVSSEASSYDMIIGILMENKELFLREQLEAVKAYAESSQIGRETVFRMLEDAYSR